MNIYILLTKCEGRTGRISARGLDSTDGAQRGSYKKDQGPTWLIRDYYTTEIVWKKNLNDRLQRNHKFQARNFYLEQIKLNVYSRLTFSKRRKTKLQENKNNILCGVNTF